MNKTSTAALLLVALLTATALFAQRPPAAAPPTEHEAVDRMVTGAEKMINNLEEINDMRGKTPESQQLRIYWQKRLLQAKYLQPSGDAAHQAALDDYVKTLRKLREEALMRTDIIAGQELPFDYALAEADYFKATGKWP